MYSIFSLIFGVFVIDSIVSVEQNFHDDHPFIDNDQNFNKNATKIGKFMLIPSIGYENADVPGRYTLVLNGWCYQPMDPSYVRSFIGTSIRMTLYFLDKSGSSSEEMKQERLFPFFVRDIQDQQMQLHLSDSHVQKTVTDKNGRFRAEIIVNSLPGLNVKQQVLKYTATIGNQSELADDGVLYLMQNKVNGGCSIISDIDDTIKISNVPNKNELLVNTFKKKFKAVPGMSIVYRSWQSLHGCLIHYVSAMPSQLYYATQQFLDEEQFPGGSFHMRHLKLADKDKTDLIKKLLEFIKHDASLKHKIAAIRDILDHAPVNQEFIMVGDSGELDPEIYGQIARHYPARMKMIYIRLVDGGKNDPIRFENAFKDVSKNKWQLFLSADKLPMKLYENKPIPIGKTVFDFNNNKVNGPVVGFTNKTNILPLSLFLIFMSMFVSLCFRRDV